MAANTERNDISPIERIANKQRRESSGNIDRDEQVDEYEEIGSKEDGVLEYATKYARDLPILMVHLNGRLGRGDYSLSRFIY